MSITNITTCVTRVLQIADMITEEGLRQEEIVNEELITKDLKILPMSKSKYLIEATPPEDKKKEARGGCFQRTHFV